MGKTCKYLTIFDKMPTYKGIERDEVVQGENIYVFPSTINKIQKQVLALLEVSVSYIYKIYFFIFDKIGN